MLPLGNYTTDLEILVRTRAGYVRRPGHPSNEYRLFAACGECDGPAEVRLPLPPGLSSNRPFQAFVSWEDSRGLMVSFGGAVCGYGRRTMEQFAAAGAKGALTPWAEANRRLQELGPDHAFWRTHASHQAPPTEGPFRRLLRP